MTGSLLTDGSASAREQIVRAAAESLLENGYAGTSVRADDHPTSLGRSPGMGSAPERGRPGVVKKTSRGGGPGRGVGSNGQPFEGTPSVPRSDEDET